MEIYQSLASFLCTFLQVTNGYNGRHREIRVNISSSQVIYINRDIYVRVICKYHTIERLESSSIDSYQHKPGTANTRYMYGI